MERGEKAKDTGKRVMGGRKNGKEKLCLGMEAIDTWKRDIWGIKDRERKPELGIE